MNRYLIPVLLAFAAFATCSLAATAAPTTQLATNPIAPATTPTTAPAKPLLILPATRPAGHAPLAVTPTLPVDQPVGMVNGVFHLPLTTSWEFCSPTDESIAISDQSDAGLRTAIAQWQPAVVPGGVHLDLTRDGLIGDPFWGMNELALQWIFKLPWTYRCKFDVPAEQLTQPRVELVADGIDNEATVSLNGHALGKVQDMHLQYRYDVKVMLKPTGNELTIAFPVQGPRELTRKQNTQYGWDFSPLMQTVGVYRPIRIEAGPSTRIDFVQVRQVHADGKVTLNLSADGPISSRLVLDGKEIASGNDTLVVDHPQLWWPSGMGDHPLYDLYVTPRDGSSNIWHRRIGLRTIALRRPNESGHAQAFYFEVNGKPFFAKGASVVPPCVLPGAESPAKDRQIVDSAVDANMNMLRVWSGGVFWLDDFYDRADERGLLVWQEMAFLIYKDSPEQRDNLSADCAYQVKRLQSHPCIALWCGNNEGELARRLDIRARPKNFDLEKTKAFVFVIQRLMPDIVAKIDPDASWLPSSPDSPEDMMLPWDDKLAGDLHEWTVWHGKADPHEYEENRRPRFASEFGLESLSSIELLRQFCPANELDLTSPTLTLRNKSGNKEGEDRLALYIDREYRKPKDFESLVCLTQLAQARSNEIGIMYWRRLMPHCMGSLIWQLNDTWPATTWSILDFDGAWKAGLYTAKRDYASLAATAFISPSDVAKNYWWKGDRRPVQLQVLYDGPTAVSATLDWSLCRVADGSVLAKGSKDVSLHPMSNSDPFEVDCTDGCKASGDANVYLRYRVRTGNDTVFENVFWFTPLKQVELPEGPINVTQADAGNGAAEVTLTSPVLQVDVWLHHQAGQEVSASDNAFILFPNEPKTIRLKSSSPKIVLTSLRETY